MNSTDRLREMRMRGEGGPKSHKFCGRLLSIAPYANHGYQFLCFDVKEHLTDQPISKGFLRACNARQWMIKCQLEGEGEVGYITLCQTFVKNCSKRIF